MFHSVIELKTVDSTNNFAKEKACDLKLPALITAEHQTSGRGRQGKSFYSPAGTGLYMTVLAEVKKAPELITPAAAVIVCRALEELAGLKPGIKWVNDIFLDDKKVCGILTEYFERNGRKFISIGIGINLTTKSFPDELKNAGSIGYDNKEKLKKEISDHLIAFLDFPCRFDIAVEYDKRLMLKGKKIIFFENGNEITGTVKGTDSDIRLKVEDKNGKCHIISSGEIILI